MNMNFYWIIIIFIEHILQIGLSHNKKVPVWVLAEPRGVCMFFPCWCGFSSGALFLHIQRYTGGVNWRWEMICIYLYIFLWVLWLSIYPGCFQETLDSFQPSRDLGFFSVAYTLGTKLLYKYIYIDVWVKFCL